MPQIVCGVCGTANQPENLRCANPECNSLLKITGVLSSEDTTLIRKKESSPIAPIVPTPRTSEGQISQNVTPLTVQSSPPTLRPPTRSRPRNRRIMFIVGLIILILLLVFIPSGILLAHAKIWPFSSVTITPTSVATLPSLPAGIGSKEFLNKQYVGVNDGSSFPFDLERQDPQNFRQQAMKDLQPGGSGSGAAISLWHQYLTGDNENDAEILIYLQNQDIANKKSITLMIGLDFPTFSDKSSDVVTSTRSVLQGVYVAQKEFNDRSKDLKLRLLLVNTGDDPAYVDPVAKQMASIINNNGSTVIGILGWQTSVRTESMLEALQKYHVTIPMISQTASSDYITDKHWTNLFRIAPLNKAQAQAAVLQAKKLQATNAIVFRDEKELYSQSLGDDIKQDFEKSFPGLSPIEVHFDVDNTTTQKFATLLQETLKKVQDPAHTVVFFAGTTDRDVGNFQDAFVKTPYEAAIAGDAGYVAHDGTVGRWYFVGYAYHDEWETLMGSEAPFTHEYSDAFDPENRGGGYGHNLADAVAIISYDAAKVLLRGVEIAISKGAAKPTSQDLLNSLATITGPNAWQGISGLIDFDANNEAVNKSLLLLWIGPDESGKGKYIKMLCVQGEFAKTVSNKLPPC